MNRYCERCGFQDSCSVYAHIVLVRYDHVECPLGNPLNSDYQANINEGEKKR